MNEEEKKKKEVKVEEVDDCISLLPEALNPEADYQDTYDPLCKAFNRFHPNCTNACPLYSPLYKPKKAVEEAIKDYIEKKAKQKQAIKKG